MCRLKNVWLKWPAKRTSYKDQLKRPPKKKAKLFEGYLIRSSPNKIQKMNKTLVNYDDFWQNTLRFPLYAGVREIRRLGALRLGTIRLEAWRGKGEESEEQAWKTRAKTRVSRPMSTLTLVCRVHDVNPSIIPMPICAEIRSPSSR